MKKLFIILTIIAVWCASYIIGYNTTSTTTNLLLIKPAAEDQTIDWYSNMNDNLDLIDAAFDDPMAYSDDTIVVEDFADDDWGEASIASNVFSIDDDVLLSANFADEDWGDMSVSSNSVTLDENVVDATALHVSDVSDNIAADIAEGELADSIIVSADIKDGVIAEADLKVVNSPNDEEIFSYEATTGDFEWHTLAELSIQPLDTALTNISALVYVSPSFIKLTADDTYAVRTLDEVKTDLGINPTKVLNISASGADYTTIQAALTANSAGGELFLVYPGTYTNDTINFTANDQCVVGVGLSSQQYVTHTQTIITLGAYTGCKIHNIKMKMTVTGVDDLMTGSGSLAFRDCWLEVAASGNIAGIVPIFNTTGTVKMNRGSLVSANTAASAGQVKRVIDLGAGAVITLNRVDIDITGSGAATAHTLVYGSSTGKMNIYRCDINIDDDAATITAGLYDNSSGAFELQSNTIHVYNDVGSAYGYYFTTASTKAVRSIYNHIGVISSGGTSNSWLVGANVTLTSQFDDVVATTSSVTGTLVLASSVNDGDISLSSEVYTDVVAEYTADAGVTVDGVLLKDSLVSPVYGGTGVANNAASTITVSGNFGTTLTVTEATAVTLPASGTLYGTLADSISSANLLSSMSDETGTGVAVFGTSPTFTTQITTPKIAGSTSGGITISSTGDTAIDGGSLTELKLGNTVNESGVENIITSTQYDYTAELEGFVAFGSYSQGTQNNIYYGGGFGGYNAATSLYFYTAANDSTRTGTVCGSFNINGHFGVGTSNASGNLDVNAVTDADPHFLLSENDVTMWDIFSQHDDNDKLVIKAGATKRYEFGTDGTANADVAWGTFSPHVEGEGKELLAIALEDANKPVKPYEGIPVVKTDEELFDMIPTPHEEEVPVLDDEGVQLTNPFGKPLFETVIEIKDEKVYRPRKDNEFATEAEKQVEYDKYHKVPAKIAIANAKYLEYLTEVIDAMQLKIDELEARIQKLENPIEPK